MLSLIILLPLAATLLIWLLVDPRTARWVAGAGALLTLGLTLVPVMRFDAGGGGIPAGLSFDYVSLLEMPRPPATSSASTPNSPRISSARPAARG